MDARINLAEIGSAAVSLPKWGRASHALSLVSATLLLLLFGLAFPSHAQAQITAINNGATVEIDRHTVCRNVTNNSGARIMVPTGTAAEWTAFRNKAPAGVSFATCVPPCGGYAYGGFCWYYGANGGGRDGGSQTCTSVCYYRGGYNEGTRTFAGSHGTNENCRVLMAHFIGTAAFGNVINNSASSAQGCVYYSGYTCDGNNTRGWRETPTTTADAIMGDRHRVCACNN